MKSAVKYAILGGIGGVLYFCLEMLWRGRSHWAMIVVGGLCFILCGLINEIFTWDTPLLLQAAAGAVMVTFIELLSGLILNIWLGLDIWDYSNMPLNIMGQVCLPFSLLWVLLSGVAIVLDDYLRYWLFDEEKPHYRLL